MNNDQNNLKHSEIDSDDDLLDIGVSRRLSVFHAPPSLATSKENPEDDTLPSAEMTSRAGRDVENLPEGTPLSAALTTMPGQSQAASMANGGLGPGGQVVNREPSPTMDRFFDEAHDINEEGEGFGTFLRETAETIILAVLFFLVIRAVVQNYRIEGQSMEPNFYHGQYLLVNKLAYRLGEYTRGDVIVFHYPNDPSQDYIKRVIGLPGDTVEIREGMLFINGFSVNEPYDHMPMMGNIAAQTVSPGHLYVLGDNRPTSSDTRSWGQLDQDFVIGQAWLAIWPLWPFEQVGLVKHPSLEIGPLLERRP